MGTTYLWHLVTVKVQREAGTVVVQVAGARQAQGFRQQGLLGAALPPGRTGWLQALVWGLLLAPLPRWARGTQGVGPAGQQARLVATPHLAAVPVAVHAVAAVTILHPGAPVCEGQPLRPAGPPIKNHCGEKEWGSSAGQPWRPGPPHTPTPARPWLGTTPPPTFLAPGASPARRAAAVITVDLIHTRGPIGARRGLALVDVCRQSGPAQEAARVPMPTHSTQGDAQAGARRGDPERTAGAP